MIDSWFCELFLEIYVMHSESALFMLFSIFCWNVKLLSNSLNDFQWQPDRKAMTIDANYLHIVLPWNKTPLT